MKTIIAQVYEVRIGNQTFTIGGHSFDNVIGHLYDFVVTFDICNEQMTHIVNKPHIRLAPKPAKAPTNDVELSNRWVKTV